MMPNMLPRTSQEFSTWTWLQIEPITRELAERTLTAENLEAWLANWSHLRSLLNETSARLQIAASMDTTDIKAEACFSTYQEKIFAPALAAEQKIKENLLNSELAPPPEFEIPMRTIQVESDLYCEENLPLLIDEQKLINDYNG
jgi:oligoendopeptidase F